MRQRYQLSVSCRPPYQWRPREDSLHFYCILWNPSRCCLSPSTPDEITYSLACERAHRVPDPTVCIWNYQAGDRSDSGGWGQLYGFSRLLKSTLFDIEYGNSGEPDIIDLLYIWFWRGSQVDLLYLARRVYSVRSYLQNGHVPSFLPCIGSQGASHHTIQRSMAMIISLAVQKLNMTPPPILCQVH